MQHADKASTAFLRLPQVLERIPVSPATWHRGVAAGRYPQPIKLSERTVAWRENEINDLAAHLAGGVQ